VAKGEVRRVRFRAEWVEEVLADLEPGDRVQVPFRELIVRGVAPSWEDAQAALAESQERGTPLRFPHFGHASSEELGGADVVARLAPTLVEPGATWLACAEVGMYAWPPGGHNGVHERSAATLGQALDAFPGWAEQWLEHARRFAAYAMNLTGKAELAVVEPGGPERGRTVLRVFLGSTEKPLNAAREPERVIAALEGLCEEAERLYGDSSVEPDL
jgi:hypothetical protein